MQRRDCRKYYKDMFCFFTETNLHMGKKQNKKKTLFLLCAVRRFDH